MSARTFVETVCLALVLLMLTATPARAGTECFQSMAECFREAAWVESFWFRLFAALDCELNFVVFIRVAVLGL